MKTIQERLRELPGPYGTHALKNCDLGNNRDYRTQDLSHVLAAAFDWSRTPEGYAFWDEVHSHLIDPSEYPLHPPHESWAPTQINGIDL